MVSPDFLQRFQQRALTDKPANSVGIVQIILTRPKLIRPRKWTARQISGTLGKHRACSSRRDPVVSTGPDEKETLFSCLDPFVDHWLLNVNEDSRELFICGTGMINTAVTKYTGLHNTPGPSNSFLLQAHLPKCKQTWTECWTYLSHVALSRG